MCDSFITSQVHTGDVDPSNITSIADLTQTF